MPLPNPGMSFTPFDPLPASELNDIVENVESLAEATGFNATAFIDLVTTGSIAGTIGGSYSSLDLGGIRFLWGVTAGQSIGAGGNPTLVLAFPSSSFSGTPTYYSVTPVSLTAVPNQQVWTSTVSSTQMSVSFYNPGGTTGGIAVSWLVIGRA